MLIQLYRSIGTYDCVHVKPYNTIRGPLHKETNTQTDVNAKRYTHKTKYVNIYTQGAAQTYTSQKSPLHILRASFPSFL